MCSFWQFLLPRGVTDCARCDLSRAREGFMLVSDLHLVYLVTPINIEVEPDWELFDERFMELSALELVKVLAKMVFWGIGINMEGCLVARNLLGKKLRCLEKEAYNLAGMTFSFSTAADMANVLHGHLKLPVPKGRNKGKQHPSTDKHCLDLLRDEHPIIPVIKEHRRLAKLSNCTSGSICSLARLSQNTNQYTLQAHWLQLSTATGKIKMEAMSTLITIRLMSATSLFLLRTLQ